MGEEAPYVLCSTGLSTLQPVYTIFTIFSLQGKLYFLQSTTYEELDEDDYVDLEEEEENNFRSPHRDPITQAGGQKL